MYVVKDTFSPKDIFKLEKECFVSDAWTESAVEEAVLGNKYLVCSLDDELVGYVCFSHILDEAEILKIAVKTDHRRRGVASILIEKLKTFLASKGISTLLLEVRRQNLGAIALYSAHGFSEYAIRKNYYHNPDDDAVLMSVKI